MEKVAPVQTVSSNHKKIKASKSFIIVLAIVSITGFFAIVSKTLFNANIDIYAEASLMIVIGIGLMLEGKLSTLKYIKQEGLTATNFTHLVTIIIGFIALLTGIFTIPAIDIQTQGFLASKGIISVIAIFIIIIQTWIIE
jgi:hypothetical protein